MPSFTRSRLTALFALFAAVFVLSVVQFGGDAKAARARAKAASPMVPNVTATMTAALQVDGTGNGVVNPGDTLRYTVTVSNIAPPGAGNDATNVRFSDVLPAELALVGGSLKASPIAAPDTFTASGNIPIAPTGGVLANDVDPLTGNNTGLTVTQVQGAPANVGNVVNTTAAGLAAVKGSVNVASDGTFTYEPPPGFTGSDTFTYRVSKADGTFNDATVTITITGMAWFIDNSSVAANSRGTFSQPFKTIANFNTVNTAGTPNNPQTGQVIELRTGTGTYSEADGINLLDGQKLIGGAVALNTVFTADANSTAAYTTFAGGTTAAPTIGSTAATNDGIDLGNGNTVRGLNVGATTGSKILGTSFGNLTVGTITLSGNGQALNLTNGTFVAGSAFTSITSTSSTNRGLFLSAVVGSVSFGSTTISGQSIQCITVQNSTVDVNFGNTLCTNTGEGILLSGNSAGTRTFGTLSSTGGNAGAFIHTNNGAVGGGNVTVTGTANLSTSGNAISVSSPANGNQINFQGATTATTSTNATAVNWSAVAGTTASMTFNSLTINRNNGIALIALGGGTINVTNATGAISATNAGGAAIVATSIALNANFSGINCSGVGGGGTSCVSLTNVTGTSDFGTGALSGSSAATFLVSGGGGTVSYGGTISKTSAGKIVDIQSKTGGGVTLSGDLTCNTSCSGINVSSNTGGTSTFSGSSKTINTGTSQAVTLATNTGATISFTGGGLDIDTTTAIGFGATGGGTVNVTGAANTLTTTTGSALTVSNITNGTMTFTGLTTTGGAGVSLTGTNTGSTFNFTGVSIAATGSNIGFVATGGGIVNVTGATNTVSTVGKTAVNISNTTIGANNVTFQSVATTTGVDTTIILDTTGAGSFTITGTATDPATGGTINHSSNAATEGSFAAGIGVYLNNASNVSLSNMNFTGAFGNFGIRGAGVDNFTLKDSNLTGTFGTNNANPVREGTIRFGTEDAVSTANGLTGTALFSGNTIGGSAEDNVAIFNYGAGSLNVTFQDNAAHPAVMNQTQGALLGNTSIQIQTGGAGNGTQGSGFALTALIDGVTFNGARGDMTFIEALNKSNQNITFSNNTINNTQANKLGGGININSSAAAGTNCLVTYKILNNTFVGSVTSPIVAYYKGDSGVISGVIDNNTIGNPLDASTDSSGATQGDGMIIALEKNNGGGTLTYAVNIKNNKIGDLHQSNGGITFRSNNLPVGGVSSGTEKIEATVTSNIIKQLQSQALSALYAQLGGAGVGDTGVLGLDLHNNTFDVSGTGGMAIAAIDLDQLSTTAHYNVPGYAGATSGAAASTALASFWEDASHLNVFTLGTVAQKVEGSASNGITNTAFTLTVPTRPPPTGDAIANVETASPLGEMARAESGKLMVENAEFGEMAHIERGGPSALGEVAYAEVEDSGQLSVVSGQSAETRSDSSGFLARIVAMISPTVYSQEVVPEAPQFGETVCVDTTPNGTCTDGFTLPAGSSFTVTFDAQVAPPGTINPAKFSVSNSGLASYTTGETDTGPVVTTIIQPENIAKAFNPTSIPVNSGVSTLTFTVKNDNPAGAGANATGVNFTDTFPANLVLANGTFTNACGAPGTLQDLAGGTPTAGDTGVKLVGGTLNAVSTCTITVQVSSGVGGDYPNTTGAITSTQGATGLASNTVNLRVSTQTASAVSVSGRVVTHDGRGVTNACVTITDSSGTIRTAITSRGGAFNFDDVPTGYTYIVSVASQRFTFQPQVIAVTDEVQGLTFTAEGGR